MSVKYIIQYISTRQVSLHQQVQMKGWMSVKYIIQYISTRQTSLHQQVQMKGSISILSFVLADEDSLVGSKYTELYILLT